MKNNPLNYNALKVTLNALKFEQENTLGGGFPFEIGQTPWNLVSLGGKA